MPNGDNDQLWRELHRLETSMMAQAAVISQVISDLRSELSALHAEHDAHVSHMADRWNGLSQRQSQIPSWVLLATTIVLTVVMNIINWIITSGP